LEKSAASSVGAGYYAQWNSAAKFNSTTCTI